jgi:hypothetical protein
MNKKSLADVILIEIEKEKINMDSSEILNALYFKNLKEENLEKQVRKIDKINREINKVLQDSFENGYAEGEKSGRNSERLNVRGKIVGNLFINTDMTDEDIYKVVGFGEENWKEHIKYLRKRFNEGVRIGKVKYLINEIIKKFGDIPDDIKLKFEGMDYDGLKDNLEKSISLAEFVSRVKE